MRLVGFSASVLLIVLLSLANASAQSVSTAQINGTVKDQPVSALNSPNFGLITSAADPRIIQLALKYTF